MSAGGAPDRVGPGHDPLAGFRERFVIPDPDVVYLDDNSLGRPPVTVGPALAAALDRWAGELVVAWDDWIDLGLRTGDRLAPLLGRAAGTTLVGESVTVNLYKAVVAVLDEARRRSGAPPVVIADRGDFPTDRYVVAGVVDGAGGSVHWVDGLTTEHVADALATHRDGPAQVVALVGSAVSFVTAAVAPVAEITDLVHDAGARVIWDLSHAAGAVPLTLDAWHVDVAVGCTYKYLHGGPGAPGYVSLGPDVDGVAQPIHGWFSQRDQFAMGPEHDPLPGIGGWQTGTPPVLGLVAAGCGIDVVAEAGIDAVRARSLALGRTLLDGWSDQLEGLGFALASPVDDAVRGGHVALRHADASRIVRAARERKVIADFRAPDIVRLGPGPLTCRFDEAADGIARIADVVRSGAHEELPRDPGRVT